MHSLSLRRLLRHLGLIVASYLVVASLPAQAAEDSVEIQGEVVAVPDGRVRVKLAPTSANSVPAPGDSVSFHKTVDGFELEAGSGAVDEVGAGFVWVKTADERVNVGVKARVRATGEPGAPGGGEEFETLYETYFPSAWDPPGHPLDEMVRAVRRLDELAGPPGDEDRDGRVAGGAITLVGHFDLTGPPWSEVTAHSVETKLAIELLQIAVRRGREDAAGDLARLYSVVGEDELALRYYREGAEMGDAYGAYYAGYMHLFGIGIHPDEGEARRWFDDALRLARESDHDWFQRNIRDHLSCSRDRACREQRRAGWEKHWRGR